MLGEYYYTHYSIIDDSGPFFFFFIRLLQSDIPQIRAAVLWGAIGYFIIGINPTRAMRSSAVEKADGLGSRLIFGSPVCLFVYAFFSSTAANANRNFSVAIRT